MAVEPGSSLKGTSRALKSLSTAKDHFSNVSAIWKAIAGILTSAPIAGILVYFGLPTSVGGIIDHLVALPPPPPETAIVARPFVNLTPGQLDDSFSLRMALAINNALTEVRTIRLVSSSTTLKLRDDHVDIPAIAETFGLTHVIEGWVQKQNKAVLIHADLVDAKTGTRLHSINHDATFDGKGDSDAQLTEFVTQEAEFVIKEMAKKLRLPLSPELRAPRLEPKWRQEFLKIKDAVRLRKFDDVIDQLGTSERPGPFLKANPNYAPAWELLAQTYRLLPTYSSMIRKIDEDTIQKAAKFIDNSVVEATKAAEMAISLDNQSAQAYSILAFANAQSGKWTAAESNGRTALQLDPNDPDVLHDFSQILTVVGLTKEAHEQRNRLRTIETDMPVHDLVTAEILHTNGEPDAAIAMLEALPAGGPQSYFRNVFLARAYAATGRFRSAADALLQITSAPLVSQASLNEAARLLRLAPRKTEPRLELEGELNFVYLYIGHPERVLNNAMRYAEMHYFLASGMRSIWLPEFSNVRRTSDFKTLIRQMGIEDFWRARGWPELCRPIGNDDFTCS